MVYAVILDIGLLPVSHRVKRVKHRQQICLSKLYISYQLLLSLQLRMWDLSSADGNSKAGILFSLGYDGCIRCLVVPHKAELDDDRPLCEA